MNKIPPPRESKIQRSIIVRLSRLGIKLWRRNVGAISGEHGGRRRFVRFGSPGMSDLWGVDRAGRHWEIECKRPGNKPTELQLAWLKEMSGRGCVAFWSDCANIAERVAEAIIGGGNIVWREGEDFDVMKWEDEDE